MKCCQNELRLQIKPGVLPVELAKLSARETLRSSIGAVMSTSMKRFVLAVESVQTSAQWVAFS